MGFCLAFFLGFRFVKKASIRCDQPLPDRFLRNKGRLLLYGCWESLFFSTKLTKFLQSELGRICRVNYKDPKSSDLSFQSRQLRLLVELPLFLIWIGVILTGVFILLCLAVFLGFLSSLVNGGKTLSAKLPVVRIGIRD